MGFYCLHIKNSFLFKTFVLFCLAFSCFVIIVQAQQNNFKTLGVKNGLSGSVITSIFQDSKGYMWIATDDGGLNKFDGKTFTSYTTKNGLPTNTLVSITEDRNGNIWAGMNDLGVAKFDGISFKIYNETNGLPKGRIYSLYADNQKNIWISTQNGAARFDGNNFNILTTKDGLPTNEIFSVIQDKKNNYWFGTKKSGLCRYDGKSFKTYIVNKIEGDNSVYCLKEDRTGKIWLGTIRGGIRFVEHDSVIPYISNSNIDKEVIYSLTVDNNNNVWAASEQGAIKISTPLTGIKENNVQLFAQKNGLASNFCSSIIQDKEGKIWLGTGGGGINILNDESISFFTEKDGLINNSILACEIGLQKNILISHSSGGISTIDLNKQYEASVIKTLQSYSIASIVYDKNKTIWAGTSGNGILKLKNNSSSYVIEKIFDKYKGNVIASNVLKVITANDNEIWAATFGSGVYIISDIGERILSTDEGLPTNNTLTIFRDKKNNIWIGTFNYGVTKYEENTFKTFNNKDGLAGNTIYAIEEDKNGALFFGSQEGGISVFKNGTIIKNITRDIGLVSDNISALHIDERGNLWVGTDKGVNRITFDINYDIEKNKYYGEAQGLKGITISQNGITEDEDGNIWICSDQGLIRIDPLLEYTNNTPPHLVLTDIKLFFEAIDSAKTPVMLDANTHLPKDLSLAYNKNHLTFYFQALTIDEVKYSYQLEGLDDNWSPWAKESFANYPKIPPGSYTLKVRARNSDGFTSDEVLEYSFVINPPWWKTWWFYALSVIVVFVAIWSFVSARTAKLAKQKKILEDKVEERTSQLKESNNKLSVALTDITDSINYAKKIQDSILPLESEVKKHLPDSFVFFRPRNVVSGDFYWFKERDNKVYIAAVDCTGHGVPGAFMSMIGNSLLNEITGKKNVQSAAELLDKLNVGVRIALKQDRENVQSKDGMDLAVCVIDRSFKTIDYSGARRPFYFAKKNPANIPSISCIKADRYSIGGIELDENFRYTNHRLPYNEGDTFYIFSDGYVDQFGGPLRKKFTTKRFEQFLVSVQEFNINHQYKKIEEKFYEWKSDNEQVDDVLVIGVQL